ncbi:MAG TPA: hypothetical protein VKG25_09570 [Bryobacteraceae bacterium]|nr:hypothetical protein [Bryobacteraceae bacterium]
MPAPRNYPVSFGEWRDGTETMYLLEEVLEARLAAGLTLSDEEKSLLKAARRVTARYERNGRRKLREPAADPTHQ